MLYPNVNAERARLGMSQEQLADRLGITRKTLYTWLETGIPKTGLKCMAEIFDVSPEYLLHGSGALPSGETLGENIRFARKVAGMTQAELAEALDLAMVTIQQYERNLREPKYRILIALAKALGLPGPEYLLPKEGRDTCRTRKRNRCRGPRWGGSSGATA